MKFWQYQRSSEYTHKTNSLWMIIYTDMVSSLMIFFLMCYCLTWLTPADRAIAAASFSESFAGKKGAVKEVMGNIDRELERERQLEERIRQEFKNVVITPGKIQIILPSPVLFDSGSAVLKDSTKAPLHQIAEIIRSIPSSVIVEGHTDNVPIKSAEYDSNWELSSARSFSIIRYLSDEEHLDPALLSALGYGEFRPVAPNDTNENRAKNRRIEINILKNK
ncbi:MAG: flagellar motor protein MotB [Endomicrobiales bacterium]|nr:flagellar motor protein MotB [Endomicrobiales bacterium]